MNRSSLLPHLRQGAPPPWFIMRSSAELGAEMRTRYICLKEQNLHLVWSLPTDSSLSKSFLCLYLKKWSKYTQSPIKSRVMISLKHMHALPCHFLT